ncbi:MAG: endonuclease/exonuclease/phosphatase family protein [Lentisphaeria bacterium]|nr:endonuclease/exonuclease/phosphatase family protein [Candidatus Neomarinimicrobiota bacterium]MCF7842818.1 endonuclease/exonuclease/phosphatase family protein [Lentisphaeria bacterium]
MLNRILLISLLAVVSIWSADRQFFTTFWNVENLFDTVDDPQTRDEDFTPTESYEWTTIRLQTKYQMLAQVINQMNEDRGPDILGLAEVEHRGLTEALVRGHLRRNYKVIQQDSPDERGIDCALLYDPEVIQLKRYQFIPIPLPNNDKTREIVEGEFDVDGNSLFVFINHWPSRWGGTAETDPKRRLAAATLRERIDLILKTNPAADILIMGDLNDYPDNGSVLEVLAAKPTPNALIPGELYNSTWPIFEAQGQGTYMYRGEWNVIDHVIVSQGLLDKEHFVWMPGSTDRFLQPYQLQRSGKYAGYPFRMYAGGKYLGGYSDHLPVFCKIRYND